MQFRTVRGHVDDARRQQRDYEGCRQVSTKTVSHAAKFHLETCQVLPESIESPPFCCQPVCDLSGLAIFLRRVPLDSWL